MRDRRKTDRGRIENLERRSGRVLTGANGGSGGSGGGTGTVTGTGVAAQIALWSAVSAITGDANLTWDSVAKAIVIAAGGKLYSGTTGDIVGDVGDDYIAIKDAFNGGIRGVLKNTQGSGDYPYSAWSCVSNENNDVFLRINGTTINVPGLHNTVGASVVGAGTNGTSVGPGARALILVNTNNDSSSVIILGVRDAEAMRIIEDKKIGIRTTTPRTDLDVLGIIRVTQTDNSNYGDLSATAAGVLKLQGSAGKVMIPGASGSTFSDTSHGLVLADILDSGSKYGYKIGFDSVGATKGYIRYNVDTHSAGSATWGHVFSGGPQGTITNWAFIGGGRMGIGNVAPAATLHVTQATVGSEVFRIESTATNDDPADKFFHGRVATTDATVTTINTVTIPASTTVGMEVTVRARRTGGTAGTAEDGAHYVRYATYCNVAGTATIVGSVTSAHTAESQGGWDVTFNVSSGDVQIQVTGALDNNVSWHSTVKVCSVGT